MNQKQQMELGSENIEVDVIDLLWRFMERWRLILLVSLLSAAVVTVVMYVRDVADYEEYVIEKKKDLGILLDDDSEEAGDLEFTGEQYSRAHYMFYLTQSETDGLNNLFRKETQLKAQKDYYTNSVMMSVNPVECRTLNLHYYIRSSSDGKDSDIDTIARAYYTYSLSEEMATAVGQQLDPNMNEKYAKELIMIDDMEMNARDERTLSSVLNMHIILSSDADVEALKETVTGVLNSHTEELNKKFGDHTVELVSSDISVEVNTELVEKQSNAYKTIKNMETDISTEKGSLNSKQKLIYEALTLDENETKETKEKYAPQKVVASLIRMTEPSVHLKNVLIGFVVGIALCVVLFLPSVLLRKRIYAADLLEGVWGIRSLGELYDRPKASGVRRLLQSDRIFRLHHRGRMNSEHQLEKICDAVFSVSRHAGAGDVSIVNMGRIGKGASAYEERLMKKLTSEGLKVKRFDMFGGAEKGFVREQDFLVMTAVVPVLLGGESTLDTADQMQKYAAYYDLNILGTIYLEA